jgi:hypothetical protein
MAHPCQSFSFANASFEDAFFDLVARKNSLRFLIFQGFEFDKAQVFALFPSSVGFLSHVST